MLSGLAFLQLLMPLIYAPLAHFNSIVADKHLSSSSKQSTQPAWRYCQQRAPKLGSRFLLHFSSPIAFLSSNTQFLVRLLVNGTFLHYKFESKNAASETVRQEEMCECQVDRLGREWPAAATHSLTDSGVADVSDTTYGSSSVKHRLQSHCSLTAYWYFQEQI